MFPERMTVSLEEFFKYILKRWSVVVLCIAVGITMTLFFVKVNGYSIVVPASENYEDLKSQEAYFEDYIENSVLMKMNPLNIYEKSLFIEEASNVIGLKDFVESGKIWEKSSYELSATYLSELLTWKASAYPKGVEIKIQHSEELLCEEVAIYVENQIKDFDESVKISRGTLKIVMDESISDHQLWYMNRLKDIKGQLEYTAAGCTIEVSIIIAVFFGAMTGCLISIIILLILFIRKQESISKKDSSF